MHTTEHVLNRTMDNLYHCGRSVSAHLEKKKSKCDYQFEREFTAEDKALVEKTVNDTMQRNLDVTISFVPPEEAVNIADVSKLPPEALNEPVRIVTIGDYDVCACIGQHLSNTKDVKGIFRITSTSLENGVLRMRWVVK